MKKQDDQSSVITQGCTNFRNYLKAKAGVENFGEFICTYTFPLTEIEELKKAAAALDKTPVSLRLYYCCDENGKNHKLHLSLLHEDEQVIVDSSQLSTNPPKEVSLQPEEAMAAGVARATFMAPVSFLADARKCPPGGAKDGLVSALFAEQ